MPTSTPAASAHKAAMATRTEHDFLGEKAIPFDAYWGVHTMRALENFPISKAFGMSHPHS